MQSWDLNLGCQCSSTTASAPLSSTSISAQKYSQYPKWYILLPVSEPWHLLFSRQKRASKEHITLGFFLPSTWFPCSESTLKIIQTFSHSLFSPNILLWKMSNIQKSWQNSTVIPPVHTHHLDSTIRLFHMCFFLSRPLSIYLIHLIFLFAPQLFVDITTLCL